MAVVLVVGIAIIIVALVIWAARYTKVGPNQVLVVVGRRRKVVDPQTKKKRVVGYRFIKGGGTFVGPIRERAFRLSLELITLDVRAQNAYSSQGVRVSLDAVAQIKVGSPHAMIERAAEQFLGRPRDDLARVAFETIEGCLRAVTGTMSVEEIYLQRELLARKTKEAAAEDLANMGLDIVSFTIRGISDEQGYLEAMGRPRIAEVKRDAAIGESEADRAAQQARFQADARIEEYKRDLELARAGYEAEVLERRAETDLAYDLSRHRMAKAVKAEEIEVEIAAKEKMIELEEREILRREKALEAEVKKAAEAEKYRIEQLAEAERSRRQAEAEGDAAGIRARGLAEAEAAQAVGEAEADTMARKARSWANYNEAALTEIVLAMLPNLAEKVAMPLSKIEKIVIVNSGGRGAGAGRVTADVAEVIGQLPTVIESLTGLKLDRLVRKVPRLKPTEDEGDRKVTLPDLTQPTQQPGRS